MRSHTTLPVRWILLLVCVLMGVVTSKDVAAQGDTSAEIIPIATFWQQLEQLSDPIATDSEQESARTRLRAVTQVETDAGERIAVDGEALINELAARADDATFGDQWDTLRTLPSALPQPDALRELESILLRPEFNEMQSPPFWEELTRRFLSWLFRILPPLGDGGALGLQIWGYIFAGIVTILLGWFLWYWMRSVRRQFSAETTLPFASEADHQLTANAALQQAQARANDGNYRDAVRYLYLSTLLNLDERNLLRFDRSKTNREYLRQIAGTNFAATLHSVVDVFDRVWYGFQPIDEVTYRRYERQVQELIQ